jgi:hypothetical protein
LKNIRIRVKGDTDLYHLGGKKIREDEKEENERKGKEEKRKERLGLMDNIDTTGPEIQAKR